MYKVTVKERGIWNAVVTNKAKNGDLYYVKEIYLDYWEAMSLMFQIYLTTDRNKTIEHLDYNVKQKGWEMNNEKKLVECKILRYDHM